MRLRLTVLTLLAAAVTAYSFPRSAFQRQYSEAVRRTRMGGELWTPADLDGLALWLDASDASTLWADTNATTAATNNGLVARWDDKSGNEWNAVQTNNIYQPTRSGGTLLFSGDGFRGAWNIVLTQQVVAASVSMSGDNAGWARVFSQTQRQGADYGTSGHYIPILRDGTTQNMSSFANSAKRESTAFDYEQKTIWIATHTGASLALIKNGVSSSGYSHVLNMTNTSYAVGAVAGENTPWLYGVLDEVVVASVNPSDEDRQKLDGYLADKWWRKFDLPVPLPESHPYYLSPPTK